MNFDLLFFELLTPSLLKKPLIPPGSWPGTSGSRSSPESPLESVNTRLQELRHRDVGVELNLIAGLVHRPPSPLDQYSQLRTKPLMSSRLH